MQEPVPGQEFGAGAGYGPAGEVGVGVGDGDQGDPFFLVVFGRAGGAAGNARRRGAEVPPPAPVFSAVSVKAGAVGPYSKSSEPSVLPEVTSTLPLVGLIAMPEGSASVRPVIWPR